MRCSRGSLGSLQGPWDPKTCRSKGSTRAPLRVPVTYKGSIGRGIRKPPF